MRSPLRVAVTVAATVALLGVGLVGSGVEPALAWDPKDCSAPSTCMWKDANLLTEGNSAHSVKFTRYIPNLKSHKYSGTEIKANDNVSSIWHNGNKESAYFYVNAHQQGKRFALAKKTGDGDLGNSVGSAPAGYNDKISSAYSRSCLDNGCL